MVNTACCVLFEAAVFEPRLGSLLSDVHQRFAKACATKDTITEVVGPAALRMGV